MEIHSEEIELHTPGDTGHCTSGYRHIEHESFQRLQLERQWCLHLNLKTHKTVQSWHSIEEKHGTPWGTYLCIIQFALAEWTWGTYLWRMQVALAEWTWGATFAECRLFLTNGFGVPIFAECRLLLVNELGVSNFSECRLLLVTTWGAYLCRM